MNRTALLVLAVLAVVIITFALASVIYPWHGKPVPDVVSGNIKELLIAFVAILARTGADAVAGEPTNVNVVNPPTDPVNTTEAQP